MFRSAVFNLKDIIKYLFYLVFLSIMIYIVNRYFLHKSENKNMNLPKVLEKQSLALIDIEYPQIQKIKNTQEKDKIDNEATEEVGEDFKENFFISLINTQMTVTAKDSRKTYNESQNLVEEDTGDEIKEYNDVSNNSDNNISLDTQDIGPDIQTQVVTENPLSDSYTDLYGSVKIKNETSYTLSENILNPENLNINSKNIIIFHTHTCESYTSSEMYPYTPTGSFRTTDLDYTVARVGDELENHLASYGFNVTHNKTYHDYPAYTGSYNRSLNTVQNMIQENQSDIIIDLHRDAIGSRPDYAPMVKIGDEYAAQIMFVMGTNGGGLYHPDWNSNLKFAIKVQEVANQMYPGLCKPIILRNSRYNQHLGKAACIIEVGSTGNTLEQTLTSMKYLASVFYATFGN